MCEDLNVHSQGVHSTIPPPEARRKKHVLGSQFQSIARPAILGGGQLRETGK